MELRWAAGIRHQANATGHILTLHRHAFGRHARGNQARLNSPAARDKNRDSRVLSWRCSPTGISVDRGYQQITTEFLPIRTDQLLGSLYG